MHILNGLSLDLLATLEEEKDSCVCVSLVQCGARARTIGGLTARTITVGFGLRACVCEQFACLSASRGKGVVKLEQI